MFTTAAIFVYGSAYRFFKYIWKEKISKLFMEFAFAFVMSCLIFNVLNFYKNYETLKNFTKWDKEYTKMLWDFNIVWMADLKSEWRLFIYKMLQNKESSENLYKKYLELSKENKIKESFDFAFDYSFEFKKEYEEFIKKK